MPTVVTIPATAPDETIAAATAFFDGAGRSFGGFAAVGVASFGPIDLNPSSPG